MIGDAGRGVALAIAFVNVVAVVVEEDAEAHLVAGALGQSAGGLVLVVAAEVAEHAHRAVPGHAGAHDRAFVDVVAGVVEAEAHRVVAAPAAAEPLEAGLGARAAVVGGAA